MIRVTGLRIVLAIACTCAASLSAPSLAQEAYTNVPGHDPIWAVSAYGGYYDCTGVIQGTVAAADLCKYGGRFVDGRPVSGAPKRRDADGNLLDENQYMSYRQALSERLGERINRLQQLPGGLAASESLRAENLENEINQLRGQIASLDGRYPQFALSAPQLPGVINQPPGYSPFINGPQPPPGFAQLASSGMSLKQKLMNQFMNKFNF